MLTHASFLYPVLTLIIFFPCLMIHSMILMSNNTTVISPDGQHDHDDQ